MANEREATYQELRHQKDAMETWLSVRNWPNDPEVSRILDHILLMIDRMDA